MALLGGSEFDPQNPGDSWAWWFMLVTPALRRVRRVDPWKLAGPTQPSRLGKYQTNEKPCHRKGQRGNYYLRMTPVDFWPLSI